MLKCAICEPRSRRSTVSYMVKAIHLILGRHFEVPALKAKNLLAVALEQCGIYVDYHNLAGMRILEIILLKSEQYTMWKTYLAPSVMTP